MEFSAADQRIIRGVSATLQVALTDQNGSPADAAGALTVGVTKADGTVVIAAGTATTHGATGIYTVALTPAQTATLELLAATWTDAGDGSVNVTYAEIIGGFYFSLAEARASYKQLASTSLYTDANILTGRDEVMEECERICDVSFVPRYRRVFLDGTGTRELILPDNKIRTVRSVRVYSDVGAGTYTALTSTQLADLVADPDNRIERTDLGTFTEGRSNIAVEYEHGFDRPPPDLKRASLVHLRYQLATIITGSPDRDEEAGGHHLDEPSAFSTGIPFVDAAYHRHSLRNEDNDGDGKVEVLPAGRSLEYDPLFWGLFHGGRR